MDELDKCPFCGKPAKLYEHHIGFNSELERTVWCCDDSCDMVEGMSLEAWNTRPLEDALRAELAAAEKRIKELEAEVHRLRSEPQPTTEYEDYP